MGRERGHAHRDQGPLRGRHRPDGAEELVGAGAVHDPQEGGVLPGLHSLAFDVSDAVPLSSWYGALLHGIFGFTPDSTWLQTVAYGCYLVPVMALFFRGGKAPAPSRQSLPVAAR